MMNHAPIQSDRVPKARTYLFSIVILGALLRLYGLGAESLWFDEAFVIHNTRYVDLHGSLFDTDKTTDSPMIALLMWVWLAVLKQIGPAPVTSELSDFLIRLLPCGFGVLAIPLVFITTRRVLRSERAALIAALLFAISPFHVYYAQELRVYSLYICLSLAYLYFLVAAVEENNVRQWIGLVLCEVALMYSHFIAIWTLFVLNIWLLAEICLSQRLIRSWFVSRMIAGVCILPALWHMFTAYAIAKRIKVPWYPETTWKSGLITFKNLFAGYGPTVWAYWPLFLLALLLFLYGLCLLSRRWRTALLIGLVAVVPIAANVLMWRDRVFSFYEHRVFMFSGVAALFAIAWALDRLRPRVLGVAALAAFVALSLPGLRDHYQHRLHPMDTHRLGLYEKGDFRGAAAYIRDHWRAGDLVCHGNHFTMYSMRYYLDVPQIRLGTQDWEEQLFIDTHGNESLLRAHGVMPIRVEAATSSANRFWFIESHGITFEYKPHTQPIRDWLDAHFQRIEDRNFHGLSVTLYAKRALAEPQAGERPNVVFILADTMRADRLGAVRNSLPIAPRLNRLAQTSQVFEDALANCSWTKPSMATIFASRHVDAHQVRFSTREDEPEQTTTDALSDEFETMTELLARHGYDTFGVQTNANLTQANGFAQGFAEGRYRFLNGARADWVTARAIDALAHVEPPFFLYLHYMDPHAPYEPPEAYRALFGPEPELPATDRDLMSQFMAYYMDRALTACGARSEHELGDLSPQGKAYVQQLYDAEIRFMDEQIGIVLDWLDHDFPNTIIVVAADHGEEFWEHGGMGHGTTLYQEQLRVPLLLRVPGLSPGVNPIRASLIDILPTLAGRLGIEASPDWQGMDLLAAEVDEPTDRFSRTFGPWKDLGLDLEAVASGVSLKLIRDRIREATRLYDLQEDPAEQADLSAARTSESMPLGILLDRHRAENEAAAAKFAPSQANLTQEERAQLEAIGYTD